MEMFVLKTGMALLRLFIRCATGYHFERSLWNENTPSIRSLYLFLLGVITTATTLPLGDMTMLSISLSLQNELKWI